MYQNVCKEVIACEFCNVDLVAKNGILKVDRGDTISQSEGRYIRS